MYYANVYFEDGLHTSKPFEERTAAENRFAVFCEICECDTFPVRVVLADDELELREYYNAPAREKYGIDAQGAEIRKRKSAKSGSDIDSKFDQFVRANMKNGFPPSIKAIATELNISVREVKKRLESFGG